MKIAVVGTGYVGLVTGTCFAEIGVDVVCVDIDAEKIARIKRGDIPIYEPGLDEMVLRNMKAGRLRFATDLSTCLDGVEILFSAVGTPPDEDGSADLHYVLDVAHNVGRCMTDYLVVVTKSTVPVGTARKVKAAIQSELDRRGVNIEFDVASNPEFLKEGNAIADFMRPDRVVVGVESKRAEALMQKLYKPFMINKYRIIITDIPSAEMIKYAANAMLATRISFMNEIALLCDEVGADVNAVRKGIGADDRIGSRFLYAGCGYGGSCFPKDVKALIKTAEENGCDMQILKSVERVNESQKELLFRRLSTYFNGELSGRKFAVWGLSFKPETDDMREAPALILIDRLCAAGASVRVYDPVAMDECRRRIGDRVEYAANIYEAVAGVDALLIVTEWKEFRMPDWVAVLRAMKSPVIFDGRNIYDPAEMKEIGFVYRSIGRPLH
ncbi:UDP-glucose dehydrogenase family protein [Barnesiella viscericola]|uniref:UDP-glucose dehydrogenase family protein n=1 Tax=Barnesiella viscericola TaxID=397865 RepID=UPI0023569534|nr:UDP-glucose/GDP-mannose dehydrogenase family protein [Barnesiella viscericola]